jgi:uncharacterized membrane protein
VDIPALIGIATRNDCAIEVVASVGDAALEGTPVIRVFGAGRSVPEGSLRVATKLGAERTFEQDPKYAIRSLVDIAIKALSPAINDPRPVLSGC